MQLSPRLQGGPIKRGLLTTTVLAATLLCGVGIGHAQAEWRHLQQGKHALYEARDQLKIARGESYYRQMTPEHRRHLDFTVNRIDEAIREVDLIEGRPGAGPRPGPGHDDELHS